MKKVKLTVDEVPHIVTHNGLGRVDIEFDRPGNPVTGYVDIWLERMYYDGDWIESHETPNLRPINIRLDNDTTPLAVASFQDAVRGVILQWLIDNGYVNGTIEE